MKKFSNFFMSVLMVFVAYNMVADGQVWPEFSFQKGVDVELDNQQAPKKLELLDNLLALRKIFLKSDSTEAEDVGLKSSKMLEDQDYWELSMHPLDIHPVDEQIDGEKYVESKPLSQPKSSD